MSKISLNQIRKNFGNYTRLLSASGVERHGAGYTASLKSLFLDWARVVRATLEKIPDALPITNWKESSAIPTADKAL